MEVEGVVNIDTKKEEFRYIEECLQIIDKIGQTDTKNELKNNLALYSCYQIHQLLPEDVDVLDLGEGIITLREDNITDKSRPNVWGISELNAYLEEF